YDEATFRWSEFDDTPLEGDGWLIGHLVQLGLLAPTEAGLVVNGEFAKTVAAFLEEGKGWTEEQFQSYFQEKQEIGDIAEDLTVTFDRHRLREPGHTVEAACVRRISRLRVNAGYDVESYDAASADVNYDRFIEVKGGRAIKLRFFWSENEMQIARKLGPNYW